MTITKEELKRWKESAEAHSETVTGERIIRLLDALDAANKRADEAYTSSTIVKQVLLDRAEEAEARADRIAKDFLHYTGYLIDHARIEKRAAEPTLDEEQLCLLDIAIRRGERTEKAERKLAWVIKEMFERFTVVPCPPGHDKKCHDSRDCHICWNDAAEKEG